MVSSFVVVSYAKYASHFVLIFDIPSLGKLRMGHGDAVLHVINMLCDKVLLLRGFQFKNAEWATDNYDDELEINNDPQDDVPEDVARCAYHIFHMVPYLSFFLCPLWLPFFRNQLVRRTVEVILDHSGGEGRGEGRPETCAFSLFSGMFGPFWLYVPKTLKVALSCEQKRSLPSFVLVKRLD